MGVTAEEVFATVAGELTSYRQLPQIWYQIQTKFRDEARPKSGLLRVREFAMKDSYSFDIDEAGLDRSFDLHHDAYVRVFERLGLDAVPVEASSGNMGGSDSVEFMVPADSRRGRRRPVHRTATTPPISSGPPRPWPRSTTPPAPPSSNASPRRVSAPSSALAELDEQARRPRQIKTLIYELDGSIALVVVRGDHQVNEQKLADATGANLLRPATADQVQAALGRPPGQPRPGRASPTCPSTSTRRCGADPA